MEYQIVEAECGETYKEDLDTKVTELLNDGWKPHLPLSN